MGKVLFISNCDPFGIGGGSFATRAYVKAFSEALGGDSYILLPEEGASKTDDSIMVKKYIRVRKRSIVQKSLALITGDVQRYSEVVKKMIRKMPGEFTHVVCNGSMSSGALIDFFHSEDVKVITIHHNFEHEYFKDNPTVGCFKSLFAHHISSLERKSYLRSDYNIFLTEDDQKTFERVYGASMGVNKTLGVFEFKEVTPLPPPKHTEIDKELIVVITGQLFHEQSIDSILYFINDLYQYLPKQSHVIISGKQPSPVLIEKCKLFPNIELIPNPDNMQEIIMRGDIYMCPTRQGGGLKHRIMDGLRLGIPVITHERSARGYEIFCNSNYFKTFSNNSEFQNAVNNIVNQYKEGNINNVSIYNDYVRNFSYQSGLKRVKKLLNL